MLQPFRPLLLSWSQRSDLGTLTGAEQVASPPALVGEALFCGLYANELMVHFNQRMDPHPELFDCYGETVTRLTAGEHPQILLRLFEKQLLESAGFGLQLEHEAGGEKELLEDVIPLVERRYRVHTDKRHRAID